MRKLFIFIFLYISIQGLAQSKAVSLPVSNTMAVAATDQKELIIRKAAHVVPTSNQYKALKNEFIAFIHFGPNTFTRLEWGTGKEDPKIFNLQELHTDQWCEAMKAAGMKMVILTAKHHDGFVLWQSRYTKHGIMSSPYKDGKGDVLRELTASCKKYGLKVGVYLSPADLYQIEHPQGLYGNLSKYTKRTIPRSIPGRPFKNKTTFQFEADDYNEYFLNQLFELLTEYGPIHEVWFDGAHPKRKGGQQYNYLAWKKLIKTLAPEAVIFGKEDIRWCGNEAGRTRDTEWNVIPYQENPNLLNSFADLTQESLGSRENLYDGKYLHYQQAETNTSIREGWFYRDDIYQKVRSADDVFDIYERSVGGNSTFLLNIPPNRDGKFSPADVATLKEVGERIRETYSQNFFRNAQGPSPILDNNSSTYELLNKTRPEIEINTPSPVTINRVLLQEAITTHGERVEKHAVDAWIDGQWKEIASATNIGYKRILRFPEVTASKFRIRVTGSRDIPAISNIAAYYYQSRPPQLQFTRDIAGRVSIDPFLATFNWNPHGQNASKNLNPGYTIYYTVDGSEPGEKSSRYDQPFALASGQVKAVAIGNKGRGAVATEVFGIVKQGWKVVAVSSENANRPASRAIDANSRTYWQTGEEKESQYIAIDLGNEYTIRGFAYTPQTQRPEGMLAKGVIRSSSDGSSWTDVENFEFGNLINDPSKRTQYFKTPVKARFIRIESRDTKSLAVAELDFFE